MIIHRNTKQRDNIYLAIKELGHASFEQIQTYLKDYNLEASLVTLYRNLDFLLEENKIRKVEMSGKDVYEVCEYKHHYHLICDVCGAIEDIDDELISKHFPRPEHLSPLDIHKIDVLLHGRCARCRSKNN